MKRKIHIVAVLALSLAACAFFSFSSLAAAINHDGVYEVPVEMWHAEKDKTSMGDGYIAHTGLLTVENGSATLTIAQKSTWSDLRLWYYADGSTEGDAFEAAKKNNVEIGGSTYKTAFEFPVMSEGEFVGVKFSASVMPFSPSARIKIDYDNAKKLAAEALTEAPTAATTAATTEATTAATTAATALTEAAPAIATDAETVSVAQSTSTQIIAYSESESETVLQIERAGNPNLMILCVAAALVAVIIAAVIVIKKKGLLNR